MDCAQADNALKARVYSILVANFLKYPPFTCTIPFQRKK
jgi:hypothetical protein